MAANVERVAAFRSMFSRPVESDTGESANLGPMPDLAPVKWARQSMVPGKSRRRPPRSPKSVAPAARPKIIPNGGLTSDEARRRLAKFGPNAMPDTSAHPLRMALEKFWAPVPWMLEAAIVLELALGKYVEAAIIALLLVFNAALGLFQESRAQATLAALKSSSR